VGQGQQILAEEFSSGFLSSIQMVYTSTDGPLSESDLRALSRLDERASQDPEVAEVTSVAGAAGAGTQGSFSGGAQSLSQS
jgi:predicted RND superfamily exporter protein